MSTLPVRVTLTDVWNDFHLEVPGDASVHALKQQVLALGRVPADPSRYVVKYRGAQLIDEDRTLADHGVVRNAALIMLLRRRRAVR